MTVRLAAHDAWFVRDTRTLWPHTGRNFNVVRLNRPANTGLHLNFIASAMLRAYPLLFCRTVNLFTKVCMKTIHVSPEGNVLCNFLETQTLFYVNILKGFV